MEGFVKFFKTDRGWGAIVSPEVPGDVWVHFSHIESDGYRAFEAGDVVEFDAEAASQDSFEFRATRARFLRHGTSPLMRRVDHRVVSAEPGTPDTPITPPRAR